MSARQLEHFPNLVAMFLARAAEKGDAPFLWTKSDGEWRAISWNQTARRVASLAASLKTLGLEPGDLVALVSENRPEWLIADLAIMAAGCVTVPAYTTNTSRDHAYVLENSGAKAVIVSSARLARTLLPAVMTSTDCHLVIGIDDIDAGQESDLAHIHFWRDLVRDDGDLEALERSVKTITRDHLACLIYTSGTGGAPRGVMQHHGAILHNIEGAAEIISTEFGWGDEIFLSFLPASHAYEHTAGQHFPIGLGGQIFYAESLEKLAANIEEVQPTIMVVVPRLFELLRARIMKVIESGGPASSFLLTRAIRIGRDRNDGRTRPCDLALSAIISLTLKRKIRHKFGGRVKAWVSGGAPLNPEVGLFFQSLGIPLLQGYGQTEAGPLISCNRPSAGIRLETVGLPLKNSEVRIADDGEIMVRGEHVMHGYWRNREETDRVLIPAQDGGGPWLATGDVGYFDAQGRIVITDRKKDLIVNDKGDNVSPQRIEGMLTIQPEIHQAMVFGDRRPHIVALLVPESDVARSADPAKALQYAVDRVNADLSVVEKVRRFIIADGAFTIENEQLTPSMKIRRHIIAKGYGDRLDALYRR